MPGLPEDFVPENGLGLELQERPSNESYFRSPEPEIPLGSIHAHPAQRTLPQQRVKDPSISYPRSSKATSVSKGKAPERARTRSSAKIEDLVQQLILQKDEAKESHRLLRIARKNLEALRERAIAAEEARNDETARGTRIARDVLGVQEKATRARQDVEVYKLQLEEKEREIQRQQELMRTIEAERNLAKKEAAKAREVARQLNDERLVSLAREEGRRLGFLEGMKRGRRLATIPLIDEFDKDAQSRQTPRTRLTPAEVARRKQVAEAARKEQEAAEAARREREAVEAARKEWEAAEIARKEREEAARKEKEESIRKEVEVARTQFKAVAQRELDATKRATEEQIRREAMEKERIRQEEALEAERQRERVRAEERELERQRIMEKEAELDREKEALKQREEARAIEMETIRKRQEEKEKELEAERERERLLEAERNHERREREQREAELAREREKVRELEIEREVSSTSSVSQRSQPKRLEYLPMPEPPPFVNPRSSASTNQPPIPAGTQSPLPLHIPPPNYRQPQQFQSQPSGILNVNPRVRSRSRRASQSSQETSFSGSGSTSLNNFDIVAFPSALVMPTRGGSHLSDIPEVASDVGRSPAQSVGPEQRNLLDAQGGQPRHVQASRMDVVEKWVQSTAASEINTPTEPATPAIPPPSWPNPSPHASSIAPGSLSSGTIPIESRPTSITSPTPEDIQLLSPNSRPLQLNPNPSTQPSQLLSPRSPYQSQRHLESQRPGFVPVIPDMLDGEDDIQQLMNFGTPASGFVPAAITKTNTSEGSSRSTAAESDMREWGRRPAGVREGVGSRIYGPPQTQTPRAQIYGAPSTSASQRQNQTPRQIPRQMYSSISVSGSAGSASGSNIHARAEPSSRPSNIYAPPTSGTTSQQTSLHPDASNTGIGPISSPSASVSGIPVVIPSSPRRPASIYAPSPRTIPIIPPPTSRSSSVHIPAPSSDRLSVPVIPPPPQRQIYSPNTGGSALPSSSANGYPYPVSPGSRSGALPVLTSRSYTASLPHSGLGVNTPGSSVAPLPTMAGWGSVTATPMSRMGTLARGSATPHAPPMTLDEDEDEDEDDHDFETRRNTEANRSGKGGMTLPIPPMK